MWIWSAKLDIRYQNCMPIYIYKINKFNFLYLSCFLENIEDKIYSLLLYPLASFIFFTIHLSLLICILFLVYKLKHSHVRSCLIPLNTKIININFL